MKIKTEVLKSIYIVTCDGPSLNPVLIQGFVTAMKEFIARQQLDILLDLSGVESIDSTKLGSVLRFFDELDSFGFLILCGVSDRVINLLKMTHLEENFIRAENRNSALSTVFWEKKKSDESKAALASKGSFPGEEAAPPESSAEVEEDEEILEVDEFEILEDGWEIVGEDVSQKGEKLLIQEESESSSQTVDGVKLKETRQDGSKTPRKFRRVKSRQISDDDIVMYCKNLSTGKHHTALLLDISVGSLFVELRPATLKIGEELLLKGRIGRAFMLKEKAVACSLRDGNKYGLEFVDLSSDGSVFLTQLVGSVK